MRDRAARIRAALLANALAAKAVGTENYNNTRGERNANQGDRTGSRRDVSGVRRGRRRREQPSPRNSDALCVDVHASGTEPHGSRGDVLPRGRRSADRPPHSRASQCRDHRPPRCHSTERVDRPLVHDEIPRDAQYPDDSEPGKPNRHLRSQDLPGQSPHVCLSDRGFAVASTVQFHDYATSDAAGAAAATTARTASCASTRPAARRGSDI